MRKIRHRMKIEIGDDESGFVKRTHNAVYALRTLKERTLEVKQRT